MVEGLLFANAVAKAKEEKLFSSERLNRMLDAKKLSDAVKVLIEANYGCGTVPESPEDYEEILAAEETEVLAFIAQSALVNAGFECFFLQADYFNAKALLKASYRGTAEEPPLKSGGYIPVSELKEKLFAEEPNLTPYLDEAVKEIRKACEGGVSPRAIDTFIDKAMYKDIAARLKPRTADKYVKLYFSSYVDCVNIDSFVRSARVNADVKFFASNFIEGGTLTEDALTGVYPDADKLTGLLKNTPYSAFADKLNSTELTEFDTARDNFLLEIFHANRSDMFTVAPIMGYYIAKMNEIKTLRIVLISVKNGVARADVSKRLRNMYA